MQYCYILLFILLFTGCGNSSRLNVSTYPETQFKFEPLSNDLVCLKLDTEDKFIEWYRKIESLR